MSESQPLAAKLRPQSLDQFYGQAHLLAPGKTLHEAISQGQIHSMILWGPPGTGKTTLARLLAEAANAEIESLSAVMAGVKDIRQVVARAAERLHYGQATILFIDEIHRFNKSQQDAFLPFIEDGTITLIGATTENPSFELNSALLSRARVYVLQSLEQQALQDILKRAVTMLDPEQTIAISAEVIEILASFADGDARSVLNYIEVIYEYAKAHDCNEIDHSLLEAVLPQAMRRFDKHGEAFYDQISALHKSVRGSDPNASLYWLTRMLDGGCDPLYIARRVVRMASEDVGNADPRALTIALNAWDVQERLGSPEGELAIAQAVTYIACAAKSNAVYSAYKNALADAKKYGSLPVPLHLRNAPTKLMKALDYGKNYRYAHDEPNAYVAGENYFPEKMPSKIYYHPVERGLEKKIKDKLDWLKTLDQSSKEKSC